MRCLSALGLTLIVGCAGASGAGSRTTLEVDGSLSDSYVRSVIEDDLTVPRNCFERATQNNPELTGGARMRLRFLIDGEGQVVAAQVDGDAASDTTLNRCIADWARNLNFDAPEGEQVVAVSYPIVFAPR